MIQSNYIAKNRNFISMKVIDYFFRKTIKNGFLTIVYKDKKFSYGNSESLPEAKIVVENSNFFRRLIKDSEIGLGESYVAKEWTSPCLEDVTNLFIINYKTIFSNFGLFSKPIMMIRNFLSDYKILSFSESDSKKGMGVSYNVGNDFFRLTLGETMSYTCAIFKNKETTLDEAQNHKMQVIMKKLQLSPNHKVLEIGCGWGKLLHLFQREYNCKVRGIAIAKEQIEYCKKTIPDGQFDFLDYRNLMEKDHYDRVVGVGVYEHVGQEYLETFANKVAQVLKPGGKALFHLMIKGPYYYKNPSKHKHLFFFGHKYMMPVSYAPHCYEVTDALLNTGKLRILHQEKLGSHYPETLRRWIENLVSNRETISRIYSPEHFLAYEYAWTSLGSSFLTGCTDVLQILVEKSHLTKEESLYDPRT